jgi:hypothetical protein
LHSVFREERHTGRSSGRLLFHSVLHPRPHDVAARLGAKHRR